MMILVNGQFIDQNTPLFSAENRSFRYGDGFFESMRMINGEIQWPKLHADRIQKAAEYLMFDQADTFNAAFIRNKATQLANKNRLGPQARFRLHIYRDGAGLYTPQSNTPNYILQGEAIKDANYALNTKGMIINLFDKVQKPIHPLSQFKTANALVSVLAAHYRNKMGLDDVIILNQDGYLCETTASNIFVKYQGKLYTPSAEDGCVLGVMRSKILEIAEKENIEIIEAHMPPDILNEAEEVFLTNAVKGVQWVMGYGKKRYFKEMTLHFSALLNQNI